MKTLIVVDMQKDFIDGALGTKEAVAIVPKVQEKIGKYRDNNDNIIFTMDTHFDNYLETQEGKNLPVKHCIGGSEGWQIPPEIDLPEYFHITKSTFGFQEWDSRFNIDFLKFSSEIEIIGLCTDICVVSNALILKTLYPEILITVDASCCAGVTPELHKAAIETMKSCQINIIGE